MVDKMKRIFALIVASVLVIMVVVTFILGIMGSDKFLGMLACDVIVPIFLFSFIFVYNFTVKSRVSYDMKEESDVTDEDHEIKMQNESEAETK